MWDRFCGNEKCIRGQQRLCVRLGILPERLQQPVLKHRCLPSEYSECNIVLRFFPAYIPRVFEGNFPPKHKPETLHGFLKTFRYEQQQQQQQLNVINSTTSSVRRSYTDTVMYCRSLSRNISSIAESLYRDIILGYELPHRCISHKHSRVN
ncbi:hypothetical protein ABVT39_015574 [Epinephelus coioides]